MSLVAALALALASLAQAAPPPAPACTQSSTDDITVCAERRGPSPYRLPKLPEKYDPKAIRAETDLIPGVHTRAHVDSVGMPDGAQSNRVMITFSTPF